MDRRGCTRGHTRRWAGLVLSANLAPLEIAIIALEGAVDSFCGRPRNRNPYRFEFARWEWEAWDLGWTEANHLLELRGQAEAARWLREAA
jgi:hypothetical protein